MLTLRLSDSADGLGGHRITATMGRHTTVSEFSFRLDSSERERIRWYMEDYLENPFEPASKIAAQAEGQLAEAGRTLFQHIFGSTAAGELRDAIRAELPRIRIEIETIGSIVTDLPWELLRDPLTDNVLALTANSLVYVSQVFPPPRVPFRPATGPLRVLLVICRPGGRNDVPFRVVARHIADLDSDHVRIHVLRPPTFARLSGVLAAAVEAGRPYHVVHFDGHGTYTDVAANLSRHEVVSPFRLGRQGYLLFENPASTDNRQFVDGVSLGTLLVRNHVRALILNACRSAYTDTVEVSAATTPEDVADDQARVHSYSSLAQEVTDAGVSGVVAMRYALYADTAAQFMAALYSALASGLPLGEAASHGRRQLSRFPNRTIAFTTRRLQDWCVPVVHESVVQPFSSMRNENRQVSSNENNRCVGQPLRRQEIIFVGRDETLLALDRAFDTHHVVVLHAYAGAGKSATAAEFARWYARTGGLTEMEFSNGVVLFNSFEHHLPLSRLLDSIAESFSTPLAAAGIVWSRLTGIERKNTVICLLRREPVMWIWDNVEPVAGFPTGAVSKWTQPEQDELADFLRELASTKAKVLLTSRRDECGWLGAMPARVVLPAMPLRDRLQLTKELADRHGHSEAALVDWHPLLRYTAGNPMATILMVGHALQADLTDHTQIAEFVEQLRTGRADFAATVGTSVEQDTLDATMAHIFSRAFTPVEQARLALLNIFRGSVSTFITQIMGNSLSPYSVPELSEVSTAEMASLFDRATEVGLLIPAHPRSLGIYEVHPVASFYFARLFERYYGTAEQPRVARVLHAYAFAMATYGAMLQLEHREGRDRIALAVVAVNEENLRHALALARKHGWWSEAVICMQSLHIHPRLSSTGLREWEKLIDDIAPDLIDPGTGEAFPDREQHWRIFIGWQVESAVRRGDLTTAERLQRRELDAQRAAVTDFMASEPAGLDAIERDLRSNEIRNLVVSLSRLGDILVEQDRAECLELFTEALEHSQSIGSRGDVENITAKIGYAYLRVSSLNDPSLAEQYLQNADSILDRNDHATHEPRAMLAFQRMREAIASGRPEQVVAEHGNEAIEAYSLILDEASDYDYRGRAAAHNGLGSVYVSAYRKLRNPILLKGTTEFPNRDGDLAETALCHFRKAIQYCEESGDLLNAGRMRANAALGLGITERYAEARIYAVSAVETYLSLDPVPEANLQLARRMIAEIDERGSVDGHN
ncbi:CHAT domain-containing protein [Streptomyces sp. MBT97]|uniref:CHAT domain-containing protein n=1 Tax=Streptomyces sp. MBT97 TaxID=2800411 RepID=UPI00190BEEF7|nr:CHAT domain-containing protein [Streptomyces sp. MBT97]MBK3631445.1 CHAT domain-containing protein [Streptomyces sp. MBT97]